MGCDIHIVLEKKHKGKWIGVEEYKHRTGWLATKSEDGALSWEHKYIWDNARNRNYDLFARLAGVRGEGPDPKGLPEDVSDLAQMLSDEEGTDGHSHSWCALPEAVEHYMASQGDPENVFLREGDPRKEKPYEFFFGLAFWDDEIGSDKPSDFRIVFWFDN